MGAKNDAVDDTHSAADELDVVRALGVAVARAVLGASCVVADTHVAVLGHLSKVQSAVQAAREVGDVDIERELLILEVEHLVRVVGGHQVRAGADVGRVRSVGDELERERIAAGGDTCKMSVAVEHQREHDVPYVPE